VKQVVLTPRTGKRCMAGTGGHVALGPSSPQRQQWLLGWREGGRWDKRSAPPACLPKRFGDRHRQGKSEGDNPHGGAAVGTGIFAHRRCSSPTHGTSKTCQGLGSVRNGIWVLCGQHHHGSGCQALSSWEMHCCATRMAVAG